ncbi:MAG: Rne/Rng family ribonuclease [Oligoflexia bacterium]|nr:Rne/Rng family ribonuclease [Oligoflexia bacterium]
MPIDVFINVRPYQTRIASVEKGRLKQIFYHRNKSPSQVGALYKGRVSKITKSLNFAFVDLGLERSGFLYGKDLMGTTKEVSKALKTGQEILVQIKADPIRNKGVRLTQEISLAGIYLVYLPKQKTKSTLSRQIKSPEERKRLNEIVKKLKAPGALIVRTFANEQKEKQIEKEFAQLKEEWKNLQEQFKSQKSLGKIKSGEDPLFVFLTDLLAGDIQRLTIDDKEAFKKTTKWLKAFRPDLAKRAELYTSAESLFEKFHLESQAQTANQKKALLKNGGFLIFEELEAFTVIDVNSGRFKGRKNTAQSLLELNLEAARKIAEQIQLRHLGGIILVDFIDMETAEDGEKVVACLEQGLKGDKSHPRVFKMGELGMAQITRKRSANSLSHFMTEACPTCGGLGRKKTIPTIATDLFLKVERMAPKSFPLLKRKQQVRVLCHPKLKSYIEEKESESLEFLKKRLSILLALKEKPGLELGTFRIEKL